MYVSALCFRNSCIHGLLLKVYKDDLIGNEIHEFFLAIYTNTKIYDKNCISDLAN